MLLAAVVFLKSKIKTENELMTWAGRET